VGDPNRGVVEIIYRYHVGVAHMQYSGQMVAFTYTNQAVIC